MADSMLDGLDVGPLAGGMMTNLPFCVVATPL